MNSQPHTKQSHLIPYFVLSIELVSKLLQVGHLGFLRFIYEIRVN